MCLVHPHETLQPEISEARPHRISDAEHLPRSEGDRNTIREEPLLTEAPYVPIAPTHLRRISRHRIFRVCARSSIGYPAFDNFCVRPWLNGYNTSLRRRR